MNPIGYKFKNQSLVSIKSSNDTKKKNLFYLHVPYLHEFSDAYKQLRVLNIRAEFKNYKDMNISRAGG